MVSVLTVHIQGSVYYVFNKSNYSLPKFGIFVTMENKACRKWLIFVHLVTFPLESMLNVFSRRSKTLKETASSSQYEGWGTAWGGGGGRG